MGDGYQRRWELGRWVVLTRHEELGDEGGGEVEDEALGLRGRLARELERGGEAVGHEVALHVVELGGIDERGDRLRRKVRLLELFRRAEGGDEGTERELAKAPGCMNVAHRSWPVMMTAHAPVFSPFFTRYASSRPSRLLAALSCSARSSSPTQPVYTTDFGGRQYCRLPRQQSPS